MKIYIIFLFVIFNVKFVTSWEKYQNSKNYFHSGFWEYCSQVAKEKPPKSLKTFSNNIYELPGLVFHPDELIHWLDTVVSLNCTFNIKAPPGKKLFAMVQSMKFDSFCGDYCCSDSIEFKTDVNIKQGPYCGHFQQNNKDINTWPLDNNKHEINKYYKHDKFGVYSNNGEIQMTIYFSKKSIQRKYYDDLVIVFTTYSDCSKDKIDKLIISPLRVDDVCLSKKFICDGIKNCPDQICDDEKNCDDFFWEHIIIVEIILIIILVIILTVFYFWKIKKNSCHTVQNDDQVRPRSFLNQQISVISAPTNCPNIDPPPTYESLFERQSIPPTDDRSLNE
ncbi:hypothetical protein HCN44_004071 [Aphidius gifuensis]|uniref:CUB domain-containing protein n=1 Tax=Aphidius gifuensis TaxID=684658 RepID=A0A834Y0D0_APHGI|nr:hypothetical protein HCN44_004071 [Aphidius gifuensis]